MLNPNSKLKQTDKEKMRTWVELDRNAIAHNFKLFNSIVDNKKTIVMPVVKSNAYGHGLVPFTKEVVKLGAKFLGVDSFEEALELRANGIKTRILVFGYTSPAYFKEASEKNISVTISSMNSLLAISKIKFTSPLTPLLVNERGNKLKIHIKVDTGLGRQGFPVEELGNVLNILENYKKTRSTSSGQVEVEGLYTHLAVGEALSGKAYTMMQAGKLDTWYQAFKEEGYKPLRHICATSSTMFFPELHYDMVRIGIGSYGLWPSRETKQAMQKKYKLMPVLSWKTIITEIKEIKKGSKIGYDLTEELKKDSELGIIPIGYWHGYPRALSGKGLFSVLSHKAKLVGRVSMDMIVLDLTKIGAKIGDEVAIIGGSKMDTKGNIVGHYAEADMMAQDADTINYEIVTRINPIIKRFIG